MSKALSCLLALGLVASCATKHGAMTPLGPLRSPLAGDRAVQIFRSGAPARAYTRLALVTAHLEKTGFLPSTFEEAVPLLEVEARRAGADAVIEVKETRSRVGETLIYNVSGTAVGYER
jgi:hypothetical protein